MLIFDQLNKADRHLQVLAWVCVLGMLTLVSGLWWVQVVRSRHYVEDQRSQSYRTVRVPAPRGKIMDRNGVILAENRPNYNISLYLEDKAWRDAVQKEYKRAEAEMRKTAVTTRKPKAFERLLSVFGYKPSLTQSRRLTTGERTQLARATRYNVTSNIVQSLSVALATPLALNEKQFHQHYERRLALPMPLISGLTPEQVSRFQEQSMRLPGVDMEIEPLRVYPHKDLAAQVVGCLTHFNETSAEGEFASFNYYLPDFQGYDGIEASFDSELRGHAGAKAVLVNNLGYRQSETILSPIEPGKDVVLTIDADVQRAAELALSNAPVRVRPARGAAVAFDVVTGEILALASAPTFDPNDWIPKLPADTWMTYTNDEIAPLRNRCVYGWYAPGSTFKTVVALAGFDAGTLRPEEIILVQPNPGDAAHGIYYVGKQAFKDTAPPGEYNFRRAFKLSSNSYFIEEGLRVGPDAILRLSEQFGFGDNTGVPLKQDGRGILPTPEWRRKNGRTRWLDGDTGNLSIGQGDLAITPLQMAVMMAAVANGGTVLWPQLVATVRGQDELSDSRVAMQPRPRSHVTLSPSTLSHIRDAMLADTEDEDGTGRAANVRYSGYRVCGKTGTAQLRKGGKTYDHMTWFASYAPFEEPRYAVIVMVQSGSSGGGTCAPIAAKIYQALKAREQRAPLPPRTGLAHN